MVEPEKLSKEEKQWIKVRPATRRPGHGCSLYVIIQDHNRRCLEMLEPYLQDDKRALSWLKREAGREIGIAKPVMGKLSIDWG